MPLTDEAAKQFKGFSKLNLKERLSRLKSMGALSQDDVDSLLMPSMPSPQLAETFIENVIGYFPIPLGVAANLCIDRQYYAIPMAVEETSIIAALSKTARWVDETGEITTQQGGDSIIGQIQIAKVSDYKKFEQMIELNKINLIELANREAASNLVKRGGGITDLYTRALTREDGHTMAVIHVLLNPCDAMGANLVNQVCEFLKAPIEQLTGEHVSLCILSNLNTHKLTQATVTLRNIDSELAEKLEEASLFAELDPHRAATSNKGILNGMDPVLIATGNDWRAVEAGVHAYAARSGAYRSLSKWRSKGRDLIGTLTAPISLGTVGGMTQLHPSAKLCLNMLGVRHADELSRIVAAVGLVQNLGAIRALTTVGIIEGHMRLHISNLTLGAGATAHEIPQLEQRLNELFALRKRITLSHAIEILQELRVSKHREQMA